MNSVVLLISICLLANVSSAFFLGSFLSERESNEALWEAREYSANRNRPSQEKHAPQASSGPVRTATKPSRTKVQELIEKLNAAESSGSNKKKYYSNQVHSGSKNDSDSINVQMSFAEPIGHMYEITSEKPLNYGELSRRQSFGSQSFALTMDRVRPENPKATGGTIRRLNGHNMPGLEGMSSSLKYLKPCSINLPHYHPRGSELIHVIQRFKF